MRLDQLVVIAKFLNMDLLAIIVTKGSQEDIGVLEDYLDDVGDVTTPHECTAARRGRPKKYNPECTEVQQFLDKALYNEYLQRRKEYTHTRPMEEFLLYYPLFDQSHLADPIFSSAGCEQNVNRYSFPTLLTPVYHKFITDRICTKEKNGTIGVVLMAPPGYEITSSV